MYSAKYKQTGKHRHRDFPVPGIIKDLCPSVKVGITEFFLVGFL